MTLRDSVPYFTSRTRQWRAGYGEHSRGLAASRNSVGPQLAPLSRLLIGFGWLGFFSIDSGHFHRHQTYVVGELVSFGELLDLFQHLSKQLLGTQSKAISDGLYEPILSVLFSGRIENFKYAVGVEHEHIARREWALDCLILVLGENALYYVKTHAGPRGAGLRCL